MAIDVSKIPNNSKFDPVREAILKLQQDVRDGVSGVATVNSSDGNIVITNSGTITVGTSGETITIGINDSTYLTASDLDDYLLLTETDEQTIAGDIVISGDLTVSGTTTYINTTNLNIGDNIITLNADLPSDTAPTENAGIEVNRGSSANKTFIWNETSDKWTLGSETLVAGTFEGSLTGNANTASALATARNIALDGDVTGNADFDGSGDITITTVVANDSHTHDGRYYTETESDNRFVNVDGDTMTDDLNFDSGSRIRLHSGAFTDSNDRYEIFATGDVMFMQYWDNDQGNGTSLQKPILGLEWGGAADNEVTVFGDLRFKSGNVASPTVDSVIIDMDATNGVVNLTNINDATFSGDLVVGTTNVYDALPTGLFWDDTDDKFKIGVTANGGNVGGGSLIQPLLLANILNEGYIPYVATGGGGSSIVNSRVSDSWLKLTSNTLELGASDPVSHEIRYARFLWQSGLNDKISTVYGARDIIASIQYLGGSATAKIEFTTGSSGGRIQFNDEYTFPATDGTSGQVLSTNGSGDLSWVAAGGPTTSDLQDVTDNGASTTNNVTVNKLLLPSVHDKQKIGLYGPIGTGAEWIGTSGGTLELSGGSINLNGANGTGTPNLKMGGTTIIDTSRNLTNIGTGSFGGNVTIGGYLDLTSTLYTRSNLEVLNAAGNGWNVWGQRDGSTGQYNLKAQAVTAGINNPHPSWGSVLIENNTNWGGSVAHPNIGSTGGSTGSLIMLDNPHTNYRTDNVATGFNFRSGIRMGKTTNGTWWDAGMTSVGAGDPYFHILNGDNAFEIFRAYSNGAVQATRNFWVENNNTTYTSPHVTAVPVLAAYNTGTAATSHAIVSLRTQGPTGGDPFISFDQEGVIGWAIGQDTSDSNKFKLNGAWSSLDSNTKITVKTTGEVGIGQTNPTAKLEVNGYTAVGVYGAPHYTQSGMAYQVIKAPSGDDGQRAMLELHSGAGGTKGIIQAVGVNNTVYGGALTNSGVIWGNDVGALTINTLGKASFNKDLTLVDSNLYIQTEHNINDSLGTWTGSINFLDEVDRLGAAITSSREQWADAPMNLKFNTGGLNVTTTRMTISSNGYVDVVGTLESGGLFVDGLKTLPNNQGAAQFNLPHTGYNAIRFYETVNGSPSATRGTIHQFGTSWGGGASVGYMNIEGHAGVNFGSWVSPHAVINNAGLGVNTSTILAGASNRGNITINGTSNAILTFGKADVLQGYLYHDGNQMLLNTGTAVANFEVNGAIRMVIDTSGNFDINGNVDIVGYKTEVSQFQIARDTTNAAIWFQEANLDTNHVLWNDYYGGPTTRGGAGSGFDGIKWNTYRGIHIRGGLSGAYNCIVVSNSSGSTNDHKVDLYAANDLKLETVYSGMDGVKIQRDLYIDGSASGNYGNQLALGESTQYFANTLQDTNQRPLVYLNGKYPALVLNHTVTSNANHGPTIQFSHNGANSNAQWVAGTNGTGSQFQIGYSNTGLGNTNWNPHNGIAGYGGTTAFHLDDSGRIGIGHLGDWGGLGGGNPVARIHLKSQQTYSSYGTYHATVIQNTQNSSSGGANGTGLLVVNDRGNHSWGVVAEFRIDNTSDGDRPSISFTSGLYSGQNWTIGYAHNSGNDFRIKRDHGYVTSSWGTTLMQMDRSGNVTFSGDVTAYSDERLKKDIKTIDNALDLVKQMRGVTYKLKSNDKEGVGVIAQEMEKVLPQVVMEAERDVDDEYEIKSVAYGNIVGVLIEAIKEQQAQIDELKSLLNK